MGSYVSMEQMGNHVCKYMEQENCVMMHDLNNDMAILNSLANYTYTHQLLKCKAF